MILEKTHSPDKTLKKGIWKLWNSEYPESILLEDEAALNRYLAALKNPAHYFMKDDNEICGWGFAFEREGETWFAIIVDGKKQGLGIGSQLLKCLQEDFKYLNGWVIDKDIYFKRDQTPYKSPIGFYLKNGFTKTKISYVSDVLQTIKIQWKRPDTGNS